MAWVRLDDRFIDHPKFLALSASAFRLWAEGMAYCNKHLTDGWITTAALKGFRYLSGSRVDELVSQTLWERKDDGFQVHDYLDWNDDRTTVLTNREKAKARSSAARTRERAPHVLSGVVSTDLDLKELNGKEEVGKSFEEFWGHYPRKVGKDAARKAWQKRHPSEELLHTMLAVLAWQIKTDAWRKDNGQFIPNPATWLNQGRWEDEPPKGNGRADLPPASAFEWVCPHTPRCSHRPACVIVSMRAS